MSLVAAAPAFARHDKTDVVTTDDGSVYVGEIKSVQYATLTLNTSPAGVISIAWRYVTGLTSKFSYRVEVSGDVRYFGSLEPSREPGRLSIMTPAGTIEVDMVEVRITAVERPKGILGLQVVFRGKFPRE